MREYNQGIKKDPGRAAQWIEIENELEALQKAVGGYIETVTFFSDMVVICDEDGRWKDKPYNCKILGIDFVGTVMIVGAEGEEFADLKMSPEEAMLLLPGIEVEVDHNART